MIKTPKITLLMLMIIQVVFIPASQANTVRHGHPSSEISPTMLAPVIAISDIHITSDIVRNNNTTAHSHPVKKNQCVREYNHKDRCGSCLCMSISVAPAVFSPVEAFKPVGHYLQRHYPLRSIFIPPPFRPPID